MIALIRDCVPASLGRILCRPSDWEYRVFQMSSGVPVAIWSKSVLWSSQDLRLSVVCGLCVHWTRVSSLSTESCALPCLTLAQWSNPKLAYPFTFATAHAATMKRWGGSVDDFQGLRGTGNIYRNPRCPATMFYMALRLLV